MSIVNTQKDKESNQHINFSEFFMKENDENKILQVIEDLRFWQDDSLNTFLEENIKHQEKPSNYEIIEKECKETMEKIKSIEKIVRDRQNERLSFNNEINNYEKLIEEYERDISSLDSKIENETESNNVLVEKLRKMEDPIIFADHIYENFDKHTGLLLLNEIQNNFTVQTVNIHKMQEMFMNQLMAFQFQQQFISQNNTNIKQNGENEDTGNISNPPMINQQQYNEYMNMNINNMSMYNPNSSAMFFNPYSFFNQSLNKTQNDFNNGIENTNKSSPPEIINTHSNHSNQKTSTNPYEDKKEGSGGYLSFENIKGKKT